MLVGLRAVEIMALLAALGLPVNVVLLSPADFDPKSRGLSARVLLAPVTGLALFAIYTSVFFALSEPVNEAGSHYWILLTAVWLGVALICWRGLAHCSWPSVRIRRP